MYNGQKKLTLQKKSVILKIFEAQGNDNKNHKN